MAADVWAGLLRDRNDRVNYLAIRHCAVRRGSFSAFAAASGPDDCGRDGDAENVAGAEARVGPDARAEVVHFDGRVFQRRRAVQCVLSAAGCGPDRSSGCIRDWVSAETGGAVLCAAEAAGQDRPDVAGQAAHGSEAEA